MKKRVIFLVLLVFAAAALCSACEKDSARQGMEELRSSELTGARFAPENTSVSGEAFRTVKAVPAGDGIVCVGALGDSPSNEKYSVYRIDPASNTAAPVGGIVLDSFETLDALADGSALVTYTDSGGDFHLMKIAPDNRISECVPELPEEMKGIYYPSVLLTGEGYLFNSGFSLTAVGRSSGQISEKKRFDAFTELLRRPDGGYLAVAQQPLKEETTFTELGQDLSVTAEYKIEGTFSDILQCGPGNEAFVTIDDMICRLDYKTGEKRVYANLFSSGNLGRGAFVFLNDESFFDGTKRFSPAMWRPWIDGEKQTITLGAYMPERYQYNPQLLKNAISSFNESNGDYYVELIDYASYGDAGYDIFLSDISAGHLPDIFDLTYMDSVLSSRGVLKDLYPLLEGDPDIDFADMNATVINTLDMGGKLFCFVPCYTVTTYVGRRSVIGGGKIDSGAFYALAEEYGASEIFDDGMDKKNFFVELLTLSSSEYMDHYNAACSFDSPEFKRCLEYARKLPDTSSSGYPEAGAYTGTSLFMRCALTDNPISNYLRCKSIFQGDMSFCGFPASSGSGTFFTPEIMLGIAENSPNQEGAWEFFKYLLSDHFQWNCPCIPIYQTILDQRLDGQVMMAKDPFFDIGLFVPAGDGTDDQVTVEYLPADETTKNEVLDIISHADNLNSFDTAVLDIIMNEMEKLCGGSESVDEAAANIQSKASLYMAEQYG